MWYNAKIRNACVGIPVGTKVLLGVSTEQHTSIGKCWWVYDGKVLRQVAESFGGRDLYQMVAKGKPFSEQSRMDIKFSKLRAKYIKNSHKFS